MHSVRVDIVEDRSYRITSWGFTDPTGTNNMSVPSKVFNFEGSPYRGFHLSKNYQQNTVRFGAGYGLYPTSKYNGFVSATMSDANGNLEQNITLTFTLSALPEYLCINFDSAQGVKATAMTINGIAVTNDSYSMIVKLSDLGITTTNITIVFTKINLAYNPLKITAVIPGLISSFKDREILEIKYASQLLDTSFNITPTIVEQYAKITFIDRIGVITSLAASADLAKDLKVMIYVDDILTYTYLTSIWDIQAHTSQITLECNDPSKKLANIQISASDVTDRTLKSLLDIAFAFTEYTYEAIDDEVDEYINGFMVQDSFITFTSAYELINDLCVVGFFRVFWDKNIFKIARCY